MKKNLFFIGISLLFIGGSILSSCTKDGPPGIAGTNGTDGTNGKDGVDGSTKCTECHNPATVELAATQFEFSKHSYGEAAFEESGNVSCTPCHASEAFLYVCKNNIPSTFKATNGVYANEYATIATASIGEITCVTCHSSLHTTYGKADLSPLTTVKPVSMTMWAGAKEINLTQDGGRSNLCVKCHQPRPFTRSNTTDKNVLDYAGLVSNPTAVFYDAAQANTLNVLKPSYRTHTHYGTVGAVFAGKGGVEFTGATSYTSSTHSLVASCQDCHMTTQNNRAGGHTFNAAGNFAGCNQTGCHPDPVTSGSASLWVAPRTEVKKELDDLAAKLKVAGIEIMNRNPDATTNLWAANTTNHYDGYLNIYDPINNPNGLTNNPGGTFKNPSTSGFSAAQIVINNGLPAITLTNAQMGSLINFQLCLREYSLGIHNYKYTTALLKNSLAILP